MQHEPFDVVLLDLRMPDMDGMKVLRALKQSWPESEVIIITGYPTLESAKEAVSLGAYDYLTKPVGPEQVIDSRQRRDAAQAVGIAQRRPIRGANRASNRVLPKYPAGLPTSPIF